MLVGGYKSVFIEILLNNFFFVELSNYYILYLFMEDEYRLHIKVLINIKICHRKNNNYT